MGQRIVKDARSQNFWLRFLGFIALVATVFNLPFGSMAMAASAPRLIVNAQAFGFQYAYGPTMIREGGVTHAFFCSMGAGGEDWDHVRSVYSYDMVHWSAPLTVLTSSRNERANCDPSIVKFNAGDGEYFYLYYSGNVKDVQTVNYVSRSRSLAGPFFKLTDRGTWEANPSDPHVVVWPFRPTPDSAAAYGAGQPSLVSINNALYQWYTDTTSPSKLNEIFLRTSNDAKTWSNAIRTGVQNSFSVDVKYDPVQKKFVMFSIEKGHRVDSVLAIRTSSDGVNWSTPRVVCGVGCLPGWSNNVGVSGDSRGFLSGTNVLVGYGAPYGLNPTYNNDCKVSAAPLCWGYWNLYGTMVDLQSVASGSFDVVAVAREKTGSGRTEWHQLTESSSYRNFTLQTATALGPSDGTWDFKVADLNRDGHADLVGIKRATTGSNRVEVHALSGASTFQNFASQIATPILAGVAKGTQFEFVDWNRDGVLDLAMILQEGTGSGKVEVHILSGASNFQTYLFHVATALHTGADKFQIRFADWDGDQKSDLVAISQTQTATGKLEVHILSGASSFSQFVVQTATALSQSAADQGDFQVADWNRDGTPDLVFLKTKNVSSGRAEIHVLSGQNQGRGNFDSFLLQQVTGLGADDKNLDFMVMPRL